MLVICQLNRKLICVEELFFWTLVRQQQLNLVEMEEVWTKAGSN